MIDCLRALDELSINHVGLGKDLLPIQVEGPYGMCSLAILGHGG